MKQKKTLIALILHLLVAFCTFPQNNQADKDVIVYVPVNNDFTDKSGNNYLAEYSYNTALGKNIHGISNQALVFNNSRASVTIKRENMYFPEFSVSFWFKPAANLNKLNSQNPLTFVSNDLFRIVYEDGELYFDFYGEKPDENGGYSQKIDFLSNDWYFINFNCIEKKLYTLTVNFKKDYEFDPFDFKHRKLSSKIYFGADKNMQNFFNGSFDEFEFSSKIKTDDELDSMYSNFLKNASPSKNVTETLDNTAGVNSKNNPPTTITKSYEKRIALIIGNSNYPESPLRNPVNDSKAIAEEIKNLGFEVELKTNVNQIEMKKAISDFGTKLAADKNAIGLFYYAGHGMQVRGKNYLIPVDAKIDKEPDVDVYCVDLEALLSNIEYSGNSMNIIILDACRNNPFARSFRSTAGTGLASIRAPKGTFIGFATAPGSTASDGVGKNGLYTQEFLKALQVPNMKIEDVFKKVRAGVSEQSNDQQLPWDNSSLVGDFYFKMN